jgi:hypothetical protein
MIFKENSNEMILLVIIGEKTLCYLSDAPSYFDADASLCLEVAMDTFKFNGQHLNYPKVKKMGWSVVSMNVI